jgi:pyruvate dehydrogenase E1 component alpha subunit
MYSEELHLIGGQAIVGAQLVMAAGIGFAIQYQGEQRVAVALFGDGAVDEGAFHEALNLASVWRLPVIFLCENNQYSMGMAVSKAWAVPTLEPRAAAYNMPYRTVDGMDALAVREVVAEARKRATDGEGPTLIESNTYRFRGHSMADPTLYRTREEEKLWRTTRDPIALFEDKLKAEKLMSDDDIRRNNDRVDEVVEDAVRFADESPDPSPDELFHDVTIEGAGAIAWRHKPSTPAE